MRIHQLDDRHRADKKNQDLRNVGKVDVELFQDQAVMVVDLDDVEDPTGNGHQQSNGGFIEGGLVFKSNPHIT